MNILIEPEVLLSDMNLVLIISAFLLGALHALEPGHGKSVMAVFVMGTHADLKDALILGLTVVFSHVIIVITLGVASLYLVKTLNADITHDIMSVVGGAILIGVGAWILRRFYHHHEHDHIHQIDTRKGVIAIGLSTGLVPCPAALVVLLLGIATNQVYNGLLYILVFSTGLALSIVCLSVLFVKGRGFLQSYVGSSKLEKLPLASGSIIIVVGLFTLLHPLMEHFGM
ncbi:sulfite exporter TauE/SafE family protein [Methanomethylovorans sp.]|uniref:HoxN/HupN/NixA family nickel/cobalt transporter n=1 Tax=Methanomethylovorans sp. TaxID=2758717 RepID=UPI00351C47F3